MRSDPTPEITVEGDLSDAAIEALATLLIDRADAEEAAAMQEDTSATC